MYNSEKFLDSVDESNSIKFEHGDNIFCGLDYEINFVFILLF